MRSQFPEQGSGLPTLEQPRPARICSLLGGLELVISCDCLPEPLGIAPVDRLELLILALERDAHFILSNPHTSAKEIGGEHMVAVVAIVPHASVINSQRACACAVEYSSVKVFALDCKRCWLDDYSAALLPL